MILEFCPKNADNWEKQQLIQYKKGTEKYNISYEDALDHSLCYGWIDSIILQEKEK